MYFNWSVFYYNYVCLFVFEFVMLLYYVCANTMYTLWSQINDSDSNTGQGKREYIPLTAICSAHDSATNDVTNFQNILTGKKCVSKESKKKIQ